MTLKTPHWLLLVSAVVLAACVSPSPTQGPSTAMQGSAQEVQLRVIAFNDFHGHLEGGKLTLTLSDPTRASAVLRVATGGAAAMAGLAQRLRAGVQHSVLLSSGDLIGATPLVSALFRHESTIEAMNLMGVDVGTVGNHEFDAGAAELQRIITGGCGAEAAATRSCALQGYSGARFPMVAANVMRQGSGTPGQTLLAPYWIYQAGPVKVGFIGAVTRTTPQIVVASGVAGLSFIDEAEAINRAARELKSRGIEAMVVMLHEGGEIGEPGRPADWNDTRCPGWRGAIVDIAQRITPDVDLILTAHTHQGYNCLIDGRPVMQAVSYGRGFSVADLTIDARSGEVMRRRTVARNLPVLNEHTDPAHRQALLAQEPPAFAAALREAQPVAAVAELVGRYVEAAAPQARKVVGRIGGPMNRNGRADSSAGRLVADAQWAATRDPDKGGAHFALMNPGGIRSDLPCTSKPPCDVSYGELFTMQPFGNTLVVMSLSGEQIKRLLEDQHAQGRVSPGFMSPSAALSYRWRSSAPYGQRVEDLRVAGQPLDAKREYRVTVNSFMADGGDGASVLREGRNRTGGPLDMDAMLAYLADGLAPVSGTRISIVD